MTPEITSAEETREALRASEEQFRLLVESVRDYGIFMLDPQGHVTSWNLGAERIKGYAAAEILGQHFSRFYPEPDVASGKPAHELGVAAAQGRFEDEGWRVRKDGSHFWANVVITALHDATGRLVGFAKVTRDLTERKRAEEELVRLAREQAARAEAEANQRRTALLAEASRLLAASLDDESMLVAVSRVVVPALADVCLVQLLEGEPGGSAMRLRTAAVAHLDRSAEEWLRTRPPEPFDPQGTHPVATAIRAGRVEPVPLPGSGRLGGAASDPDLSRLLDGGGCQTFVVAPLVARGRTLGALSLGFGDRRDRGPGSIDIPLVEQLAARVALAVDNAWLYRQARAAAEAQEAAVRAREAFLARASHELRTPLTAALGTIQFLKRALAGSLPESPEALIDVIVRNLKVMVALINDLLDASKLASGRESLAVEPIELAAAVHSGVEVVRAGASEKRVGLLIDVGPDLVLLADRLKLEQVLVNLLANAVKFTPAGGVVRVEAERRDAQLILRVTDTGEGIPPELLETIFEPFYQVRPGPGRRIRGTGLGLTICRQIVTLHGGRIWAESAGPGRGSTFVVQLPLRPDGEPVAPASP